MMPRSGGADHAVRRQRVDVLALRALRRSVALFRLWSHRVEARRALARLDARQLRDIGLDPAQVAIEVSKPFWKP